MKRWIPLYLLLIGLWTACEEVYIPKLDDMDPLMVVEARFTYGESTQSVHLYKSVAFNDHGTAYPRVTGAQVRLTDDQNRITDLPEREPGIYRMQQTLDPQRKYRLTISAEGEQYASDWQEVPALPRIDSVYAAFEEKLMSPGTDVAAGDLRKISGTQIYVDIAATGDQNYHRFTGRKIAQYTYTVVPPGGGMMQQETTMYAWLTLTPTGLFNLAAPQAYTADKDIRKYPLTFLERSYTVLIPDTPTFFNAWIYICHQYALTAQSYQFYSDLNRQLSAEGKLFDPLYTQARGNITCTSSPDKLVLGNFEISSVREHRFFVQPVGRENFFLKRIPYFYPIPFEGKQQDIPPDWWEFPAKVYPSSGMAIESNYP